MIADHHRRLQVVAFLVACVLTVSTAEAGVQRAPDAAEVATLLAQAERANSSHDLAAERAALKQAEILRGTPAQTGQVQQRLAVLDWKYEARFDAARERLSTAADQLDSVQLWLALVRLETGVENWPAAIAAARRAFERGDGADARRRTRLALSAAIVEAAMSARLGATAPPEPELLNEAFAHLNGLVAEEPGRLDSSQRLLQASLLLEDWGVALVAWRSYYRVAPGGSVPNAIVDAGTRLQRLLETAATRQPQRIAIAQALADTRFFAEAVIVSSRPGDEPVTHNLRAVSAYARLLRHLRHLTNEYYRQTVLGTGSADLYRAALADAADGFLAGLDLAGLDGSNPLGGLRRLAGARYGAVINLDTTAGTFDLHMGHVIIDDRREIQQYGRRADVRFVVLDHMVSNGFQSWAWENGAEHAGWGGGSEIVQVRPVYTSDSLYSWAVLIQTPGRRHVTAAMDEAARADDARAATDPYGFFPGLNWRLMQGGVSQVFERVSASGLGGDQLRLAFLAELRRAIQESSIFAHEGRHVIDAVERPADTATEMLEYYAKLSEVAFAPEPRLALSGIISPNIGDPSAHGRANARLMRAIGDWMNEHGDQIDGFDPGRPLLPQFDKLTDDQMRALFRSLDPLAR